jgi:hypothetical protein
VPIAVAPKAECQCIQQVPGIGPVLVLVVIPGERAQAGPQISLVL